MRIRIFVATVGLGLGALASGCADDLPLAGANTSEAESIFSAFAPPSPAEAAAAVKILQNEFGQTMSAQPEISAKDSGLQGTRFELMEGSEGDSSYLFIGQRGNTLIVFFTNGFDVDAVASTYQMVLEKLSDR